MRPSDKTPDTKGWRGAHAAVKVFVSVTAVLGAAALTLGAMIALVQGTIFAVSIRGILARVLAVAADLILGTVLLLGCIYLATHLAVRILGVGWAEFPHLPKGESRDDLRPGGSARI